MLIQFNFRNYKSYRDEVSLDMTATSLQDHKENLIPFKKEKYLKVISIFGGNASGKSNIIEAFAFVKQIVIESFKEENDERELPIKKFKFSDNLESTDSEFDIFFIFNEVEYQYGFVLDEKKIKEEWLYIKENKKNARFVKLYERKNQEFVLSKSLEKFKSLIDSVKEKTLLISFLSNLKIKGVEEAFNWFKKTDVLDFGNILFEYMLSKSLPTMIFKDEMDKENFKNYVQAFDLGIQGIRIEKISLESEEKYRAYTEHYNYITKEIEELPLSEESSGTKKMISLYTVIQNALRNGTLLFIDELDAKLHPLLTKYLVNLFQDEKVNQKGAQLIFTTHDTNILNKNIFRRDQIWFVDKKEGVSELYSLVEYELEDSSKVRNDASYDKDYLKGRYGAVPIFREFSLDGGKHGNG